MSDAIKWLIVFTAGEVVATLLFGVVRIIFQGPRKLTWPVSSILKGILERLVLTVGLNMGFAHIFTLFGALKIGTRLDAEKSQRVSNDYFLVGNLLSVLMVLFYQFLFSQWKIN